VGGRARLPGRRPARQLERSGTAALPALGHDIYVDATSNADVYELQTMVSARGTSGGPFVLPDGRVAGIRVRASSVDPDIGYAIRATEIADEVDVAIGRPTPVGTGPCIGTAPHANRWLSHASPAPHAVVGPDGGVDDRAGGGHSAEARLPPCSRPPPGRIQVR